MSAPPSPTCFISYSWDSPQHSDWVFRLADDLDENGIEVITDRQVPPGLDLARFMEQSVRDSAFVLLVCTDRFAAKANKRGGGVGYETAIVTGEILRGAPDTKFIPVLRSGSVDTALPTYLSSKLALDFRTDDRYHDELTRLVRHLWDEPEFTRGTSRGKPSFADGFRAARRRVTAKVSPTIEPTVDPPASSSINAVTDDSFQAEVIDSVQPVLVDFWAPWCGPCRAVAPVLEEIAGERDDLTIVKLNIDDNQQAAAQFGVISIPTMILFKDGGEKHRVVGAYPKTKLLDDIEPHLEPTDEELEVSDETLALTLVDGAIKVALLHADGTYSYATESSGDLGLLYLPASARFSSVIDELEALLNDPYVPKDGICEFLDNHRELLTGGDYKAAHSRVFLRRDGRRPLRPDFVLEPIAEELSDIVDIQPAHQTIATDIDGVAQLGEVVVEACARLREYRDYFEDESRRVEIEDEHGVKVFRPRMFIVIGRSNQVDALTRRRLETQLHDVKLRSWDEVLKVARTHLGAGGPPPMG